MQSWAAGMFAGVLFQCGGASVGGSIGVCIGGRIEGVGIGDRRMNGGSHSLVGILGPSIQEQLRENPERSFPNRETHFSCTPRIIGSSWRPE